MVILLDFWFLLLRGLAVTLWISWLALLLAAVIGAVVGIGRTSKWLPVRVLALVYTEFFRSIPTLVQLFFVYFGVTFVFGIEFSPFAAATIALALEGSALMSEVVRGGIQSVSAGQREAARSSGMHAWQVELYVVWPQAIRVMVPPAVGVYVSTLKASALASVIGYVELTKTGLLIRESVRGDATAGLTVLIAVAALYVIVNFAISQFGAAIERRTSFVH
ncbi:MAG: amino acid ABC transporter permease [Hyphomicrobiales bacterium]|nr:amino acid ABC transporter permease [Hyphomicrobiales bacterium]